jgi:tetratricopeptide (TPR) repeat protein
MMRWIFVGYLVLLSQINCAHLSKHHADNYHSPIQEASNDASSKTHPSTSTHDKSQALHVDKEKRRPAPLPSQPSKQDIRRATSLYRTAETHYEAGRYAQAEHLLKRAIVLHPFGAAIKILLGKVFLIQGSAKKNMTLLNSAKLMFQMANALAPELQEAKTLLELFQPSKNSLKDSSNP